MKRGMVESNYLEELLKGIPDGLFDGIYSEKDLLKIVDLPMESFANDGSSGEWGVNETSLPWPTLTGAYVGCQPVGSAVWNTPLEPKPKLFPLNSLVTIPDPILPDALVGLPLAVGDNVMKHINGSTVLDSLVEVQPTTIPLNCLITKPGPIPSDGSVGLPPVVEDQVMKHTRTGGNVVLDAMLEPRPKIMSLNGLISETQPIPSAASFGLPRVVEDKVIEHTTSCAVSDTLLESKPKLIPSNSMVPKSRPMTVDAMIGSPLVVERKVAKHTVENAHTDILPHHKIEIPSDGKAKVLESVSSRVHSPVSVLDSSSCNSAQTSLTNIKFRGPQYGKRSKRPRPEHVKTPWFLISLIPPAASAKKTFTSKNREKKKKKTSHTSLARSSIADSDQRTMENMLGSFKKKKCSHCEVTKTPQWREGPSGPKTLCNACGVRYRSGRLFPEYRPAASPTFTPFLHSNSHRKVIEMRKQGMPESSMLNYPRKKVIDTTEQAMQGGNTVIDPPSSPDSPLIENIPMIGHPFELIY